MGTDIHMFAEVRKNNKWYPEWTSKFNRGEERRGYYRHEIFPHRSYDTFAILAGVRNGVGFAGCYTGEGFNPISAPRGLPEDVSPYVKHMSDFWGEDGHNHSWLTLAELTSFDWNQRTKVISGGELESVLYKDVAGDLLEDTIPKLTELAAPLDGAEDVRIVFWFDN